MGKLEEDIASSENGVLAKWWKDFTINNKLQSKRHYLVGRYKAKNENSKSPSKKAISTIYADMNANELTWKSLVFLLFNIIPGKSAKLTIDIELESGGILSQSVTFRQHKPIKGDKDGKKHTNDRGDREDNKKKNGERKKLSVTTGTKQDREV